MAARFEIDMTKGSILKNMLRFAIPLMLTNILQLLYNAADQIVVGRWGGPECLAAVGATGSVTTLLVNLFVGLSIGASVAVSRKYGSGDLHGLNKTAHTAVALSIVAGFTSMIVGELLSRPMVVLFNGESERVKRRIFIKKFEYAPIKTGSVVGVVRYYLDDELIFEAPISVKNDIECITQVKEERPLVDSFLRFIDVIK